MHTAEDQLTVHELDILNLIAKGTANKDIAAQLSIREDTVKSHVGIFESLARTTARTPSRLAASAESALYPPKSGMGCSPFVTFQNRRGRRILKSGFSCNGCSPRLQTAGPAPDF